MQHNKCRRRRPTGFTMRAVIFLCLLVWAVAAEALTLKCKGCGAAFPETTRQRRSNWNPLSVNLNEGNNDESKLNATATAPLDGSNSTTNSSTVPSAAPPNPEPTTKTRLSVWHPLNSGGGFPSQKNKKQVPSAAPPNPEPPKKTRLSIWHPLNSGGDFPSQKNKEQK